MNKYSLIFLLLIAAFFSTDFAQVVRDNPSRQLNLARSFEREGEFTKAHKIYSELYKKNPQNFTYFNSLVRSALTLKKYNEVIALCKNKIKSNPYDINSYGVLGTAYYMKNNRDSAFVVWDNAIAINPNNEINYRIVANYALQNRAFDKALSYLKVAQSKSHNPTAVLLDIANVYQMTMDYKLAAKEYCKVLIEKPNLSSVVRRNINKLLGSQSAAKEITETIESCSEKENNITIEKLLADIYRITGENRKAFDLIKKIDSKENKKGKVIFDFAKRCFNSADYNTAEISFRYLLKERENITLRNEIKFYLAQTLLRKNNSSEKENLIYDLPRISQNSFQPETIESINLLSEIINNARNTKLSVDAQFQLAKIYAENNKYFAQADSLLNSVIRFGRNSRLTEKSLLLLGKIELKRGEVEKAIDYFRSVVKSKVANQDNKTEANFFIGKANYFAGRFTKALSVLNVVSNNQRNDFANNAIKLKTEISIFKNDSLNYAKFALGEFLIEQNKPDSAIKVLSEIAENNRAILLNNIAKLKIAELEIVTNNFDSAEKILKKLVKGEKPEIYPDKPAFLLSYLLQKEGRFEEAMNINNNFLEKYPNSLYLSIIRENIKLIKEELDGRNK